MADYKVSRDEAKRTAKKLKVKPSKIAPKQFQKGMQVEMEHRDLTKGKLKPTGQIARAHLKENKDYYKELAKMEKKLEKNKRKSKIKSQNREKSKKK